MHSTRSVLAQPWVTPDKEHIKLKAKNLEPVSFPKHLFTEVSHDSNRSLQHRKALHDTDF